MRSNVEMWIQLVCGRNYFINSASAIDWFEMKNYLPNKKKGTKIERHFSPKLNHLLSFFSNQWKSCVRKVFAAFANVKVRKLLIYSLACEQVDVNAFAKWANEQWMCGGHTITIMHINHVNVLPSKFYMVVKVYRLVRWLCPFGDKWQAPKLWVDEQNIWTRYPSRIQKLWSSHYT